MTNIKLTTLGGVRENGKNMYIAEINDSIFVLDAGLKYPENEQLGVDVVIPNMEYLFENSDRIAGVFLTHGHADAIGALPYLLSEVKVPVFGSELTIELAKLFVKGNDSAKNSMISMLLMKIQKSTLAVRRFPSSAQLTLSQRVWVSF